MRIDDILVCIDNADAVDNDDLTLLVADYRAHKLALQEAAETFLRLASPFDRYTNIMTVQSIAADALTKLRVFTIKV